MVKIVKGNLLDAKEDIIVHQVNCMGSMGGGVALAIKKKWPEVYKWYKKKCDSNKLAHTEGLLMGTTQWIKVQKDGGGEQFIVNLFGQYEYGGYHKYIGKRFTDYDALRKGLMDVRDSSDWNEKTVAMPYGIGCGRGGGDWDNVVGPMILDIFEDSDLDVVLYEL